MPIDERQLHPLFRPSTVEDKKRKQEERIWKALFYTIKHLAWKEACKNLRADGIATGTLVYDESGELVTEDGAPITALFNEYRPDFEEGFDRAFVNATIDELIAYGETHFNLSYEELMAINDERMAEFRNRQSTRPLPPARPGNAGNPPKAGISKKPKTKNPKPSAPSEEAPF